MDPQNDIDKLEKEKSLLCHTLKLLRKEWIRKCENDEDEATIFLIDAILFSMGEKDRSPAVYIYHGKTDLSNELKVLDPKYVPPSAPLSANVPLSQRFT